MKTMLAVLLVSGSFLVAETPNEKRLDAAASVFSEVMGIPDKSIPQNLLERAECIVIVPGVKGGAFIVGGKFGRGFVTCRQESGTGWTGPAAVRVESGSVGFQIGGTETDVIMLVMNEKGLKRLLTSKFTLGGDAAVAAGPVGRTASAETDALMTAEILTWSRSRGLFAGVSLKGATLRQELSVNKELYGRSLTNKDILTTAVAPPKSAATLMSELNKYSSRRNK